MVWHQRKRILLGVSGGIAAYKSAALARRLIERGCEVRVVMTGAACEFITPLTLQAVSGHPVHLHLLDADAESGMGHIELARWAEQVVIAPASANCIARLAQGRAEDLLSAVALATEAEVAVAPAMNRQMWAHPATQRNLASLKELGVRVIGPDSGDQACGEHGLGRMTEPDEIATLLAGDAHPRLLDGAHVLITAGATWEAIDPVRGISNRSSGKMGYSMAQAALDFGARVTLVSGATHLETPRAGAVAATRIEARSARRMMDAVAACAPDADLFIAVAAVADYRPREVAAHKIKKDDERMTLELIKNPDILANVAAMPNAPLTVGFALETENAVANAKQKLASKKIDAIVVNTVGGNDSGSDDDSDDDNDQGDGSVFDSEENAVTLIFQDARDDIVLAKADKYRIALQIIEHIAPLLAERKRGGNAE
ncbi:MAG: bifunctional phosphopantothenoylcysteine decarboxylase/phosphopantothenate--cysteine ligase CoaBC [bacterium]